MIDERKRKVIELLAANNMNKTDIADLVGISRTTLYDWMKDEEFTAELNNLLHKMQVYGESALKASLNKNINIVEELARNATSEKVRLDAAQYLIDRVLGKTTTKIDLEATAKQSKSINDDILEQEFKEFEEFEE